MKNAILVFLACVFVCAHTLPAQTKQTEAKKVETGLVLKSVGIDTMSVNANLVTIETKLAEIQIKIAELRAQQKAIRAMRTAQKAILRTARKTSR